MEIALYSPTMTTYILALDGTVLNIRESVYTALSRSVYQYLSSLLNIGGETTMLTNEEIVALYNVGLGEPTILFHAVLHYYLELLNPSTKAPMRVATTKEALRHLRHLQSSVPTITLPELRDRADIFAFAAQIQAQGGGKSGLAKVLPAPHPYLFDEGDLDSGDVVTRLYEEQYLGVTHFYRVYRKPLLTQRGSGFLDLEALTVSPAIMAARLQPEDKVGLFTTRSRHPVQWVLERQGVNSLFPIIVTGENINAEEARIQRRTGDSVSLLPPHPFLIEEILVTLTPSADDPIVFVSPLDVDHETAQAIATPRWTLERTWGDT